MAQVIVTFPFHSDLKSHLFGNVRWERMRIDGRNAAQAEWFPCSC